jgi:hypothetical protein
MPESGPSGDVASIPEGNVSVADRRSGCEEQRGYNGFDRIFHIVLVLEGKGVGAGSYLRGSYSG